VIGSPPCLAEPPGLVSWWSGNGTPADVTAINHGTLRNGVSFGPGVRLQGFEMDGLDDHVFVPDSASLRLKSVTVGGWFRWNAFGGVQQLAAKAFVQGRDSFGIWYTTDAMELVGGYSEVTDWGPALRFQWEPQLGRWYHILYSFDDESKIQSLFIDGVTVMSGAVTGSIAYDDHGFFLGADYDVAGDLAYHFPGGVDEVILFGRALSAAEIQSIYNAGNAGICDRALEISGAPSDQVLAFGAHVEWCVQVRGSAPLAFQWFKDDAPIPGATSACYSIAGAQRKDSGRYRIQVSNSFGTVQTQFQLTVEPLPLSGFAFGGDAAESGWNTLRLDKFGRINAAGFFGGRFDLGGQTFSAPQRFDIVAAQFDLNGKALWAVQGNASELGSCWASAVDPQGNVYLTGWFLGAAQFGDALLNSRADDVFVVKLSHQGEVLWAKSFGGAGIDLGQAIAADTEGFCYLGATFESEAQFGSFTVTSAGETDFVVARLDPQGEVVWVRQGSGDAAQNVHALATPPSGGGVFLTGDFKGTMSLGQKLVISQGESDVFAARINSLGEVEWITAGGSAENDESWSIAAGASGHIVMTGTFRQSYALGPHLLQSLGASDVFVAKLDAQGNVSWMRQAGGSADEGFPVVTIDSAENVFVAGWSDGSLQFADVFLAGAEARDSFVAKLNSTGDVLWVRKIGGPANQSTAALATSAEDDLFIGGFFAAETEFLGVRLAALAVESAFVFMLPVEIANLTRPMIMKQPLGGSIALGGDFTLQVEATGSEPLSYQWLKEGRPIPDATSATLLLRNVQPGGDGEFAVIVRNLVGEAISTPAIVRLKADVPKIVEHPSSISAVLGSSVQFTVKATGLEPLTFQWQKNGKDIPGAHSATLILNGVEASDTGEYGVLVTNPDGSTRSEPARLFLIGLRQAASLEIVLYGPVGTSGRLEFARQITTPMVWQLLVPVVFSSSELTAIDLEGGRQSQRFYRFVPGP
ncbi:MAG: immunoglobulin domain-containing protein, partial [Verrucomicrobiota bacterium]